MRKNFLQVASAVALLLTVALAGCSRDEGNANNETRSIFVQVTPAETRADAAKVPTATQATFTSGYLFFTNNSGVISRSLEIGTAMTYDPGTTDDKVGTGQLTAGIQIEDVPGTATKVYVIGNVPSALTWTPADGQNISTYATAAITVASQHVTGGGVANVTLYGDGNIVDDPSTTNSDEFVAAVTLSPVSGRLEIAKITADPAEIESFDVVGIFINYYYSTTGIDGSFSSDNLKDNGPTPGNYTASTGSYTGVAAGVIYDIATFSSTLDGGTTPTAKPATVNNVWAYNLLAPALSSTQDYFPHIVIKINNIEVADAAYEDYEGEDWYLTITNVYPAGTANPTAANYIDFEKSKIYTIGNVSFSLGELSVTPEPNDKKVKVTVTVQDWTTVAVDPVL